MCPLRVLPTVGFPEVQFDRIQRQLMFAGIVPNAVTRCDKLVGSCATVTVRWDFGKI
jgi:hypothetical protein